MTEENQNPEAEQAPATTEGEVGHAETATTEAAAEATTEAASVTTDAAPQAENVEGTQADGTEQAAEDISAESVVVKAIDVTMMAVNGMVDAKVANDKLRLALENCRAYASKKPKEEWARNIMRFCSEAGVEANVLRGE